MPIHYENILISADLTHSELLSIWFFVVSVGTFVFNQQLTMNQVYKVIESFSY